MRSWLVFLLFLIGGGGLLGASTPLAAAPVPAPLAARPAAGLTCGTGTWATGPVYPTPVLYAAVVSVGGLVYSFGGESAQFTPTTAAYRWNPASGGWTALAPLPIPLSRASAVTDGTAIYLLNGFTTLGEQARLYRYDPGLNTYTTLAVPPLATTGQAAAYLNGQIYRIAGLTTGWPDASVDVYTISTDSWAAAGTVAAYPQAVTNLAVTTDGTALYAAGGARECGAATAATYRYDPGANRWADPALTDLPSPLTEAGSAVLGGYWFLTGGATAEGVTSQTLALDLADPTGAWQVRPDLPGPRTALALAATAAQLVTVGGVQPGGRILTATLTYSELPCPTATRTPPPTASPPTATATPTVASCGLPTGQWAAVPSLPQALKVPAVTSQNGVLYSFGGIPADSLSDQAYRYDPAAPGWTPVAALPSPRGGASAVSDGQYLYIFNGDTPSGTTPSLLRYDPATDQYLALADAPRATALQTAAYLNGRIYRVSGCTPSTCGSNPTMDIYTISTNSWAAAAPLPISVVSPAVIAYGGYLYAAGGNPMVAATFRYDPSTNQWDDAAIADLPVGRESPAGALLGDYWILAGGKVACRTGNSVIALDLRQPTAGWLDLAPLPTRVLDSGGASVADAFYIIGGDDGRSNRTAAVWRYAETPCPLPTASATATGTATRTASATATTTPTLTAPPTAPASATGTGTSTATTSATGTATVSATTVPPTGTRTATATVVPPTGTATATPCVVSFSDVTPSDYFYTPVQALACAGVIGGYADGTFRPYNNTTRGQLAKIVTLGYALPLQTPGAGGFTFTDTPVGSTFYPYIETVAARGIVAGYACGGSNPQTGLGEPCDGATRPYYRGGNNVSRGQLAKIVVGAAGQQQGWALITPAAATFYDVPVGSTFYAYIETAVCHGILNGYSDRTFRPANPATRGQISKIVYLATINDGVCVPQTPAPTYTATATPPAPATAPPATATATVTQTPVLPLCGLGYHASAWVSNATPAQYGTVAVYGSLCANGAALAGAQMHTIWHYRTTTVTCDGTTTAGGVASCSRSIGAATVGYTVVVDVQFFVGGSLVATTSTSFTPH